MDYCLLYCSLHVFTLMFSVDSDRDGKVLKFGKINDIESGEFKSLTCVPLTTTSCALLEQPLALLLQGRQERSGSQCQERRPHGWKVLARFKLSCSVKKTC